MLSGVASRTAFNRWVPATSSGQTQEEQPQPAGPLLRNLVPMIGLREAARVPDGKISHLAGELGSATSVVGGRGGRWGPLCSPGCLCSKRSPRLFPRQIQSHSIWSWLTNASWAPPQTPTLTPGPESGQAGRVGWLQSGPPHPRGQSCSWA